MEAPAARAGCARVENKRNGTTRRQASASRGKRERIGTPSGVFAPFGQDAPGARFPDSRITATHRSSQVPSPACAGFRDPVTCLDASLTAYSGGTVWAFHPLRVAAGVSVD